MKVCTKCKIAKPNTIEFFKIEKRVKSGLASQCKECHSERERNRYLKNPDKENARKNNWRISNPDKYKAQTKKAALKRKFKQYGITQEVFNEILSAQNNCCAICGISEWQNKKTYPCIDHCHDTGIVRGILCHKCNTAIGLFSENIETLKLAIEYLKTSGVSSSDAKLLVA